MKNNMRIDNFLFLGGMRYCLVLLCLFSSFIMQAQLFDNKMGHAYGEQPCFNAEFIRVNRIKVIKGQYNVKRPGEVMKTTKYRYEFAFDTVGRLISSYETRQDDGSKDTVWFWYDYDTKNHLVEERRGNHTASSFIRYTYDASDRRTSVTKGNYSLDNTSKRQELVFGTETMSYQDQPNQQIITYSNSYALPYLQETITHSSAGYLMEKQQRYLMTSDIVTERFSYNEKGLVAQVELVESGNEVPVERLEYDYDANNQLIEQRVYRNGKYTTEVEFLYNEKSQLLTFILTRDVATNYLMVLDITEILRYSSF
jgi:YD repeat-containing protein